MSRQRQSILVSARLTGHVMWWVFVVSALFAGGITWWGTYSTIGAAFAEGQAGWTAYTPTTGAVYVDLIGGSPGIHTWWQNPGFYALVAFVVVVGAALVDAVAARRLVAGIVTVVVPFVALGLFVLATPGTIDGVELRSILSMALVLAGVAVREVWMRAGAPRADAEFHE